MFRWVLLLSLILRYFFFFQAEDGIRDYKVMEFRRVLFRSTGAHFGTYDYTASCDITAAYQAMRHPACDFAKHMMKVAYAGTGVFVSDGATTTMPVAPHKDRKSVV